MRILLTTAFVMLLAGCAAEPRATPTQTAAAAGADAIPAVAAPATAAPASATNTAEAAVAKAESFTPPSGYKKGMKEGREVYCRKQVVLGSRFPQMMCFSEAELRDMEARNDSMRRDMDQTSRICDISCSRQ